jgi:hypothetical protein
MKYLLGILLAASMAIGGYAQDPATNFNNGSNDEDYSESSTKGSSQDKFDANSSKKDMNNTMDMNNPLYLENGTLADPESAQSSEVNSDVNYYEDRKDDDPGSKAGNTLDKGWNKVKHNKLTKHLFNQPRNG